MDAGRQLILRSHHLLTGELITRTENICISLFMSLLSSFVGFFSRSAICRKLVMKGINLGANLKPFLQASRLQHSALFLNQDRHLFLDIISIIKTKQRLCNPQFRPDVSVFRLCSVPVTELMGFRSSQTCVFTLDAAAAHLRFVTRWM